MNTESARQTGPRSLVADDRAMSAESLRGPFCRWRTLVILGIVTVVVLAGCGGGMSQQPQGTPTISTISPSTATAGDGTFTLTISGTNFVAASTVSFGGSAPVTTFVNSMQLTAVIPAASIASTGTMGVTVINPAPGGPSNLVDFTVTSAAGDVPAINSIYPSCVPAGELFVDAVNNQLTVGGQGFVSSSVVRWNGNDQPTTLDPNSDGGILTAQISASDIAAAGTVSVTVFNPGTGGGSSNSLTFTITAGSDDPQAIAVDPAGKFAYVASGGCGGGTGGYVSMYTIDPTTGALTSVGPPVPTNDEFTDSVTVGPSGKSAYVASAGDVWDIDDGSILPYSINPTTGALTSTTGGINGTGGDGTPGFFSSVALDPSGKFAYSADGGAFPPPSFGGSSSVSMYTINSTTGAMTFTGTIAAGAGPDFVALDPAGKFAYVTNFSSSDVSMYTINATTGALASIGTIATGPGPVSVAVDPAGNFAYVANWTGDQAVGSVSMYSINSTTGALTSIGTIPTGTSPFSVAVDPSGQFVYVANSSSNDVSMYTINATTGALTSIGTIATQQYPNSIAIHPSGKFAYVTNSNSNSVSMYSIDGVTGALTLIGTVGT
jgi:YVTN family beta-propeller protein